MRRGGRVRLQLQGYGAEKVLNMLWKKGVTLHRVKRSRVRGVEVEVEEKAQQAVEEAARAKGFRVTVVRCGWRKRLADGLKKRWGLVLGFCLGLGLCVGSLQFVWQVKVENAGVYAGEVRLFLEEEGLRPGMRRQNVSPLAVQEKLQWRLPEVKWVWVKMQGVTLQIRLENGEPGRQQAGRGHVVAACDGILERLTVFSGTAVCKAGDAVKKGQVLIRGEETGPDGEMAAVQAGGQAMAYVQLQSSVRISTRELLTSPTGRTAARWVYCTPFGKVTFRQEPDFLLADRVVETLPLPGCWLPITLVRETFVECSGQWRERNSAQVAEEGQKAAEEALIRAWPETLNIDKSVKFSMIERGTVEVTASAVLLTDIAQYGDTP